MSTSSPAPDRLVVVGASLAGLRAVEAARAAGFTGSLTLVGAEPHLPYDRPPLSKALLEEGAPAEPVTFRSEAHLRDELGVEMRLGVAAVGLDARAGVAGGAVRLADGSAVSYDALVVATGARARTLPGAETLTGVHTLRTLDDGLAVRAAIDAGARTVVVGAGFIGSEVASAVRARGGEVTIVEAEPTPLVRAAGRAMGEALAALHTAHGTRLLCGTGVAGLVAAGPGAGPGAGSGAGPGSSERGARVGGVRLLDGRVLPADLVVVGIGTAPATEWLVGSPVALDPRDGGVVCDATLATSAPGVWAAGDVARWPNPVTGLDRRLEHWTSAAEQGAVAARHALDPAGAAAYGTVPYFWSDWYGRRIQLVGTPEADEVLVVDGAVDEPRWVALYRRGDRVVGALTLDARTEVMKYRALVARGASWHEALELARSRAAARRDAGRAPGPAPLVRNFS